VVGAVGLLEHATHAVPAFPAGGDEHVFLLGRAEPAYDGSERQVLEAGACSGRIPEVDLDAIWRLCELLCVASSESLLASAHDASDGGLAVALAEVCLGAGAGCDLDVPALHRRDDITLFGEACGNVVVACDESDVERLISLCDRHDVPRARLGQLGGDGIRLRCGETILDVPFEAAREAYEDALPRAMAG
jgi:phosphoribosylformylglycinamidine synthase subunit PurL